MLNEELENKEVDELSEEEMREYEGDIISALTEAAGYKNDVREIREIKIVRNGILMFKFRVHPLTEEDFNKARRQNLKNRGKRNEEVDYARQRSQLIYMATVEEDQKRLWNNKEVWNKLNVASGIDAVGEILKFGEKMKIGEVIEEISGYDDKLDEIIKN